MAKKEKQIIIGPEIIIKGSINRFDIVKKVVNIFIDFEQDKKGRGVVFKYPVEKLSNDDKLFIVRPGLKKNFDFKVEVPDYFALKKGSHAEITSDLKNKKEENPKGINGLVKAITEIYDCLENDVDFILKKYSMLQTSFQKGARIEFLLKVLKWMFIMEDIFYWDYEGREKLYNYLIGEISND